MKVFFRCDASFTIGLGHLSRCAVLAQLFKDKGYSTHLVARPSAVLSESLLKKFDSCSLLSKEHLTVEDDALETTDILKSLAGSHLVIVDHYDLDHQWEKYFYKDHKVVVIDDLANRPHLGHILIDTNYRTNYADFYKNLVPDTCKLLLGPHYSFLRKEFLTAPTGHERSGVLVFFGGTDPTNETSRFMQALSLRPDIDKNLFHFLISSGHQHLNQVLSLGQNLKCHLHVDSDKIPQLMSQAALYFGSGGTITWERMQRGLPGAVVSVADNQTLIAESLARDGYQKYYGSAADADYGFILDQLLQLLGDKAQLDVFRQKGLALVRPFDLEHLSAIL